MAKVLIVDADGGRRIHLDAALQAAGHRIYSAGSLAEAVRQAGVYVPEAVIVLGALPDGAPDAVVRALRASDRAALRTAPVLVAGGRADGPGVTAVDPRRPSDLMEVLDRVLARPPAGPSEGGA